MRAVIQSVKHYVQVSLTTVLSGASLNTQICKAVEAPVADTPAECPVGAIIKAVYIEMWVRTGDTAPGTSLISFYKGKQNQNMNFAEQIALHDYTGKADVYYHTQGLINDQDSTATPFMRGWFKVPKGKQRMALGDTLNLSIAAQALDNHVCGFMVFKVYT